MTSERWIFFTFLLLFSEYDKENQPIQFLITLLIEIGNPKILSATNHPQGIILYQPYQVMVY